ncbi:uncharacterized protein Tco025E_00706 [Trypanosoma conorhini]|uniref:Leucine-rich repeat protein (LRRP) n=1 Tax=Trypanosoma conorhini TaxID=83891 RepID=A0A422QAL6_9TRYP|nr:uncharacterized protein Tco025E_00706 [Trypanosoma conorhini]RNF27022.1 hypothetical protein Tco025E_00706 [Trypanosoma conorhini]
MKNRLRRLLRCCLFASCAEDCESAEDDAIVLKNRLLEAKYLAYLFQCCTPQEPVIPPPMWRKCYGKWVSLGPKGAEALSELLMNQLNGKIAVDGARRTLTLDLHKLRIGDDGVRAFAPFIARESRLVALVLSGNGITDEGVNVLLEALRVSSPPMRRLSLIDNFLSAGGVRSVCKFFATSSLPLTELAVGRGVEAKGACQSLVHDKVTQTMNADSIELLLSSRGNTLLSFTYGGFKAKDFSAEELLFILRMALCKTKLRHLALHDCYSTIPCSSTGGESPHSLAAPLRLAAEALCSPTAQLQSLHLQIPLSEEAVTALAVGISGATVLTKLNLRGCNMSAESLCIIGKALANNRTLLSLDLSHQSEAVTHPLCAHHWMRRLRTGEVSSNGLRSRRPLLPIFEALHCNRTLQELIVLGVDVDNSDVEELCACVERSGNRAIRRVQHTGVSSQTLAIKLEGLLGYNRSQSRNDALAGEGTIKYRDPTELKPSSKDKFAQRKPEAQPELKATACARLTSICRKPAPPCVSSSSQIRDNVKNGNNRIENKNSCVLTPMGTIAAVAVSSSFSDSNVALAAPLSEIYSPCGSGRRTK